MRTVAQFYQDGLRGADLQPPLDLLLADASGCILAQDVTAPFDHPPTLIAGTDGYAAFASDLVGARKDRPRTLPVVAEVESAQITPGALVEGTTARIASGAPLPPGADTVVPLALTDLGVAEVNIFEVVQAGQNLRHQGEDITQGQVLLAAGTRLGPAQIAALAAVGKARVVVHPRPRVVVLSIGDELVEPGTAGQTQAVFDVNGPALASAAGEAGAETYRTQAIPDDRSRLRRTIEDQMMRADLIVTTGGLSFGAGNTVREVLGGLGSVRFEEVAAVPGHILGVGSVGDEDDRQVPIVCLPGNPVAALVSFEVYVRPILRKMMGWKKLNRPAVRARVSKGWGSPAGKRQFVPVRLTGTPTDGYQAEVLGRPDKLLLSALAASNAIAVVPEDTTRVTTGETLTCMLLD